MVVQIARRMRSENKRNRLKSFVRSSARRVCVCAVYGSALENIRRLLNGALVTRVISRRRERERARDDQG
jgi:hypothetical protein